MLRGSPTGELCHEIIPVLDLEMNKAGLSGRVCFHMENNQINGFC